MPSWALVGNGKQNNKNSSKGSSFWSLSGSSSWQKECTKPVQSHFPAGPGGRPGRLTPKTPKFVRRHTSIRFSGGRRQSGTYEDF